MMFVQVSLFQGMPLATIESLAVVLTEKVYPPKSVVYYQGNEVEDLFFIQRGHIKVDSHHSRRQNHSHSTVCAVGRMII